MKEKFIDIYSDGILKLEFFPGAQISFGSNELKNTPNWQTNGIDGYFKTKLKNRLEPENYIACGSHKSVVHKTSF